MNLSFKASPRLTFALTNKRNTCVLLFRIRTSSSWNLFLQDSKYYHKCTVGGQSGHQNFSKRNILHSISGSRHSNSGPLWLLKRNSINYNNVFAQCFSTTRRAFDESQLQVQQVPADLFFPEFPTILVAENTIDGIHNLTGLPWWSSIILSAFLLRILLPLPLSVYSMHNYVRLQRIQPEIKETAQKLRKEVSMAMHQFGWSQKKAKREFIKNMKRHLRNLYIRENCHPMKDTASFWIRIPLWVSASYALRNMSVRANNPFLANHENCQSLSTEGIAWFTDLTVVDSTWILPVMMGMVTLLNVEIGRRHVSEMTTYRKVVTFALRGLSLVFIPISTFLPSGLVLYWVSSGFFSALQTGLVDRSSAFRKLIGIKPPAVTSQQSKES